MTLSPGLLMNQVVSLVFQPNESTSQEAENHFLTQSIFFLFLEHGIVVTAVDVEVFHLHVAVDHGGRFEAVELPLLFVPFDAAH